MARKKNHRRKLEDEHDSQRGSQTGGDSETAW